MNALIIYQEYKFKKGESEFYISLDKGDIRYVLYRIRKDYIEHL